MKRINTIDAHVAGEAIRLVVGGGPSVPGRSMTDKLAWLRKHGESLRRLLMLEPRGHAGMHGALLTEPVSPKAHAGLLFMHAAGFPLLSGEGVIGAVTIALEHGLLSVPGDELMLDTPAGLVRARPRWGGSGAIGASGASSAMGPSAVAPSGAKADATGAKVASVAITGVPSFVPSAGIPIDIGRRTVTVDVAFGGEFYAIADSEAIGVPIEMANASQLIRMGQDIKEAVESSVSVVHPIDGTLKGIHGTIFTGAPRAAADLRSATVLDGQVLRRSPGATGTAALLAVLDVMGLLMDNHVFTHVGMLGTLMQGSVVSRQPREEMPAVVTLVEGSASITGFHEFVD